MDRTEELQMVERARGGDIDAFERLVRTHTRAVHAHALRFFGDSATAEDVTQEVFLKVFRSLRTFDGTAAFSTWLYRVTRNTCLDTLRAAKSTPTPMDPLDLPQLSTDDFADAITMTDAVELAVRTLAPEDRDAFDAVALFGLGYSEAAEILGTPVGTVKSRVFRARRQLVTLLGLEGGRS